MDWDMKSSSQWDWENLMLFPGKGTDITRKTQASEWESETGGGDAGMDNRSLQNGSVYSPGCGSASNFGYGSSSKSCISVERSTKAEPDLCKVKVESKEPNCMEERNVVFLDLRSQVGPSAEDQGKGNSCEMRGIEEHHGPKQSFATAPDQQQQRIYTGPGCRTGNDLEGAKEMNRMEKNCSAPVSAVSGDSHIGLKLGKRTYFEDTSGGGSIKAAPVSVFPASPSVPTKKSRALTQGMQTARCQVEGCNTDLTSSKDYHRRHKVCEIHSKSAKVMVAGLEQRFCQQCSRFHLLKEFDEGKRSCRRRLAGHNERRRKPQPDSMALNSARLSSSFYDNRRPGSILMDRSPFSNTRFVSTSVLEDRNDLRFGHGKGTWPRVVKTEEQLIFDGHHQMSGVGRQSYAGALSRHNADRLLLLLQSSKASPGDIQGIHHYSQSPGVPVGQALTLSSSPGAGVFTGLEITSATQGLSGVSDSRRALSLLSSQSWGSRAPGSASMDLTTRPSATLEQFVHDNQPPMAQPLIQGMQHNFGLVADKFLTISSQSPTSLVTSGFPATGMNAMDKEHQPLVPDIGGIGNFESSMHGLLHGQDFRASHGASSKDVRRTIDLMHGSSQTQSNESQGQPGMVQHGSGQFMEIQLMRPYESSVFDSHQM